MLVTLVHMHIEFGHIMEAATVHDNISEHIIFVTPTKGQVGWLIRRTA